MPIFSILFGKLVHNMAGSTSRMRRSLILTGVTCDISLITVTKILIQKLKEMLPTDSGASYLDKIDKTCLNLYNGSHYSFRLRTFSKGVGRSRQHFRIRRETIMSSEVSLCRHARHNKAINNEHIELNSGVWSSIINSKIAMISNILDKRHMSRRPDVPANVWKY